MQKHSLSKTSQAKIYQISTENFEKRNYQYHGSQNACDSATDYALVLPSQITGLFSITYPFVFIKHTGIIKLSFSVMFKSYHLQHFLFLGNQAKTQLQYNDVKNTAMIL